MKLAPLVLAAVASAAQAAPKVELSFLPPDKYTDIGDTLRDQTDNLKTIGDHVTKLAEQRLADGQTLTIAFAEIDLAGRPKMMHRSPGDYRIMTGGADWPHMRLHWTLSTPGQPDRGGDADLSDMNYLWGVRPIGADKPLYYDERMFDAWFTRTVAGAAAP